MLGIPGVDRQSRLQIHVENEQLNMTLLLHRRPCPSTLPTACLPMFYSCSIVSVSECSGVDARLEIAAVLQHFDQPSFTVLLFHLVTFAQLLAQLSKRRAEAMV